MEIPSYYLAALRNAVRFEIGGVVAYVTEGDVRII